MASSFQLTLLVAVTTLCAVVVSQECFDEIDTLNLPNPCSPCSKVKKWRCISDPHITRGPVADTWERISQCEIRKMQRQREKDGMAYYLVFKTKNKKECLNLNSFGGIYGCCEKVSCPEKKKCCPKTIEYTCEYGVDLIPNDK